MYHYDIDAIVPFTGYVLFSPQERFTDIIGTEAVHPIYEVGVIEGHVTHTIDISDEVLERAKQVEDDIGTDESAISRNFGSIWAFAAHLFARRYDVIYSHGRYRSKV